MHNQSWITARAARWGLFVLVSLSMLLAGCSGGAASPSVATALPSTGTPPRPTLTTTLAASPTPAPAVPQTGSGPTQPAEDGCPPTPPETRAAQPLTMGPINGAGASSAPGERLIITGTVYDSRCRPVPGMTLSFWQTDPEGVYGPGHGTNNMVCCFYGGETVTDDQGRYTLLTVVPGVYKGQTSPPPAHIHVEGEHPSGARLLGSEIVFQNDPHLSGVYDNPPPIALAAASDEQGAYSLGAADFRLAQQVETASAGAAATTTASATAPAAATPDTVQTFTIVPGESSASYQIREKFADIAEMVAPVGVTSGVEGQIQLDLAEPPALTSLSVTVDLRGLRTDDPLRDEKLADRWLVTNTFPYATFTAREIKNGPAVYQQGQAAAFMLSGDLTIRDITRPVDFTVTATLDGDTLNGQAETTILMSDFGVDPPSLLGFVKVEDEVTLRIELRAVRL